MSTGHFTFKWNDPTGEVQEVYVTGTFDAWGKSTPLTREGDAFVARVELPLEKHQYKFVVDNEWVIDPDARKEFEDGIENNI
ncbi:immunoglobulin E-set, partial [Morchella snyderi]